MQITFILYVNNQKESTKFYSKLLDLEPSLFVKGMTEFILNENTKLGLMPNDGIAKLFPKNLVHPKEGIGIPRCEFYINSDDVKKQYQRAIDLGAKEINKPSLRDWGAYVGYVSDIDGHIIAFYKNIDE